MKVSIITVSYNSEKTIQKTFHSILAQEVLPEEYILIDGGSTDGTLGIAEKFRPKFQQKGIAFRLISEPDKGIYDAMNKGIRLAEGDIIGIINSDDWYEPCAVRTAVKTMEKTGCDVVFGAIRMWKRDGSNFVKKPRLRNFQTSRDWNHPTMFVKRAIYRKYPFRNKGIHDDYGCYLKMRKEGCKICISDEVMANFRMGGKSNHRSLQEAGRRIEDRYLWCYRTNGYSRWYIVECVAIEMAKMLLG